MKIDRYRQQPGFRPVVKPSPATASVAFRPTVTAGVIACVSLLIGCPVIFCTAAFGQDGVDKAGRPTDSIAPPATVIPDATEDPTVIDESSSRDADRGEAVVRQVLRRLSHGPAFNAKLRKRVWISDREVLGFGIYEQAGGGTGHYNLQVTMLDGESKHTLQQISDGRLAWTRTVIGDEVLLRRVDVRLLQQRLREAGITTDTPPHLSVGGLTELVGSIARDYTLTLKPGTFKLKSEHTGNLPGDEETFLVVSGSLKDEVRGRILGESGRTSWPELCPTHVQLLVAAAPDPEFDFGEGLPRRLYFFSDPLTASPDEDPDRGTPPPDVGPLISLIELYAIQPITTPSANRFSFESRDRDNHYVNETQRYLSRYGL